MYLVMMQMHADELAVKKVAALNLKSKARRNLWQNLMNKGDYAHNIEVLKSGDGFLVPKRRTETIKPTALIPCDRCLVFISKQDLWRHAKHCPMMDDENKSEKLQRKRHHVSSHLLLPSADEATAEVKKQILATLAHDEVSLIVRNDPLIVSFACRLFARHGHQKHQHQYIRTKLFN